MTRETCPDEDVLASLVVAVDQDATQVLQHVGQCGWCRRGLLQITALREGLGAGQELDKRRVLAIQEAIAQVRQLRAGETQRLLRRLGPSFFFAGAIASAAVVVLGLTQMQTPLSPLSVTVASALGGGLTLAWARRAGRSPITRGLRR